MQCLQQQGSSWVIALPLSNCMSSFQVTYLWLQALLQGASRSSIFSLNSWCAGVTSNWLQLPPISKFQFWQQHSYLTWATWFCNFLMKSTFSNLTLQHVQRLAWLCSLLASNPLTGCSYSDFLTFHLGFPFWGLSVLDFSRPFRAPNLLTHHSKMPKCCKKYQLLTLKFTLTCTESCVLTWWWVVKWRSRLFIKLTSWQIW
jgi:hypothetical protein